MLQRHGRFFLTAQAVSLTLFSCTLAIAEGAEHGGQTAPHSALGTLVWPAINFIIFLCIVAYGYNKKGKPALTDWSDSVRTALERSTVALQAAERELQGIRARHANLEEEKRVVKLQIQEETARIAQSIIDGAKEDSKRAVSDSISQREHAIARLQNEVSQELAKKALARASQILSSGITADDDRRLRDEVLSTFIGSGR